MTTMRSGDLAALCGSYRMKKHPPSHAARQLAAMSDWKAPLALPGVRGEGDDFDVVGDEGGSTPGVFQGSLDDLLELHARIEELDRDVKSHPNPQDAVGHFHWTGYLVRWNVFHAEWIAWKAAHQGDIFKLDSTIAEFGDFRTRYNLLLDEFVHKFNGNTQATPDVHQHQNGLYELAEKVIGVLPWLIGGALALMVGPTVLARLR